MKSISLTFGFLAGCATALGFLPHIIVMAVLVFLQHKGITSHLLIFTLLARVLGDWLYWVRFFPTRMDLVENMKGWRSSVREAIFFKAPSFFAIFDMVIDISMDIVLVWMAFKASASPLLTLLVFCACQSISAPIQGIMIYLFEARHVRLFSMLIGVVAVLAALEINGVISRDSFINIFGLSGLTKSTALIFVLGAKCLFTGLTIVGKDTIAQSIIYASTKRLSKNFH